MEEFKDNSPELLNENISSPEIRVSRFNDLLVKLLPNRRIRNTILYSLAGIVLISSIFLFIISILYFVPVIQEKSSGKRFDNGIFTDSLPDATVKKQLILVQKEVEKLSKRYNAFTPGLSYIVINTTDNRFSLYNNKKLIREGFCSTGKLTLLKTADGDNEWVFRTPRGERRIQGKITKPLWSRPDWSFIEEGLPVPPQNDPSRYEYGVLGDYGLSIGNGYLIHGTIYQRFLGMPVTHGCVRLGDADLKVVYNTLNIGSKVFIF